MEKIPSLITLDAKHTAVLNPEYDWVLSGKGVATRMYDGRCYAVLNGKPYAHSVSSHLTTSLLLNEITSGLYYGWEPVSQKDQLFWQVWNTVYDEELWDWSYELCGPEVNGDPEHCGAHVLKPHGTLIVRAMNTPTLDGLYEYLRTHDIEGLVWWEDLWNPHCRKVKVQQSDFNLKRRRTR